MTEVEKLRTLLAEAREWVGGWSGMPWPSKDITALRNRIDAALAEPVGDDFRRGAEAMREAAAQYLRTKGWFMNQQVACSVSALPLPEDKP